MNARKEACGIAPLTDTDLSLIMARADAAFRGPWTADTWEVRCDAEEDCGDNHDLITIEAPEEYPDGQVVAQVPLHVCSTPGLETFAEPNSKFIAHAREDVPRLVAALRRARESEARLLTLSDRLALLVHDHCYHEALHWEECSQKPCSEVRAAIAAAK